MITIPAQDQKKYSFPQESSGHITMAENLPDPQEIRDTAATGAQLSRQEVADLAKLERDMTGRIEKGGPAATAQRIYTKQQEFLRKADNVIAQPIEQISKEEADEIRDLEACDS